ncbi:L-threonylcarbamoyladenylate synthase [Microvirga massiliensis]|uniref:L-threonylcarbamoyladenylate synthase n=1 Tax=Microvirga massiliensis TaxID=1033741 RepID=UPI0009E2FCD6|nr:L-threonylcarbamoyladenylate synthase [Microvirga massiliensis]
MKDQGSIEGLRTEHLAADDAGIARAADLLKAGRAVAFPTETVYGLGADATQGRAVAAIYAAKERPSFNPLIAHVADLAAAQHQGVFGREALRLAEAFWPGPLTLVVPLAETCEITDLARAGLPSIGLRVPAHPVAHALLTSVGQPLAAPSANRSGRMSPTQAEHVLADLNGRIAAVLDAGPTSVGVESTIVSCLGDELRILRPGGIPREQLVDVIGRPLPGVGEAGNLERPSAPGMLESHYAPRARVRLHAEAIRAGEAILLFGPFRPAGLAHAAATVNLSPSGDLAEAAARLFSALRELDESGAPIIAVVPIPPVGLGEAINDRLARAAADRPPG